MNLYTKYTFFACTFPHCLPVAVTNSIRAGTDHCADLLRQKLMCDADVGLIPMYWVKNHDHPWPDFSTTHRCRIFEDVRAWVDAHQVQVPEGYKLMKAADTIELEVPP